jgi:hypothetical protein
MYLNSNLDNHIWLVSSVVHNRTAATRTARNLGTIWETGRMDMTENLETSL